MVNVDDAIRKNANFWTGTMGFDSAVWDTTGVATRGYPLLRDVEEQRAGSREQRAGSREE